MKKLVMLLLSVSFLFSLTFDEWSSKYGDASSLEQLPIIKNMTDNLHISREKKMEIINKGLDNPHTMKGLYYLFGSTMNREFGKNKHLIMPRYVDALSELKKACQQNDLLASYVGLEVLWNHFLFPGNQIGQKFLRDISKPLAKERNIVGLFWYGKSFSKEWGGNDIDEERGQKILQLAKKKGQEMMKNDETLQKDKDFAAFMKNIEISEGNIAARRLLEQKINNGESILIKRKLKTWHPPKTVYTNPTPAATR